MDDEEIHRRVIARVKELDRTAALINVDISALAKIATIAYETAIRNGETIEQAQERAAVALAQLEAENERPHAT